MTGAANSGIGVLLVNLGTPDAPTPQAVKRYLREFLSDPRVVEIPALVWQPILRGIVLNTRPKKSAHAYSQVWTDKGSPLAAITAEQAQMLQQRLGDAALVRWGMRYGNPALGKELQALQAAGCERILIAPLYPQYSAATNASVSDKMSEALAKMRAQPALRTLPPYYDDPLYISALANDLGRQIDALPFDLYRQGYHYYWRTNAHPGSTFKYTTSSLLDLMRWDATDQIDLIDQPLLMLAGSKADTAYMTDDAFAKATGTRDKKLVRIEGARHIETYWVPKYVDVAMDELMPFFERTL